MESIKATFFQECDEQLVDLEAGLQRIREGDRDPETLNAVFRCAHSIKGGAGAFGLTDLVTFAHAFETALDRVRNNDIDPTPGVCAVLLRAADVLSDLVGAARGGTTAGAAWQEMRGELEGLGRNASAEAKPAAAAVEQSLAPLPIKLPAIAVAGPEPSTDSRFRIAFRPHPRLYANANDPLLILAELCRLGECRVSCDVGSVPMLDALDPQGSYLGWSIELDTTADIAQVRDVFEFVDTDCDLAIEELAREPAQDMFTPVAISFELPSPPAGNAPGTEAPSDTANATNSQPPAPVAPSEAAEQPSIAPARDQQSAAPATIRVDLERVDRLIDLVGELVINQAMLTQRVVDAGVTGTSSIALGLEDLKHLTREIQDSVMAIRAQPVKSLFQRMSRIVREAAQSTSKQIRLKLDGEGTEVDKTVIERLADPLTHMIRNAIDHGIESPDKRTAACKPPEGVVQLSAAHRSGRVVIEIADDGAGINRPRVREVAIAKGLIPAEAQLSDSEIDNLLFLPGFSTASSVSSLSGRGVGMDVVKKSIQALGGRIAISSNPGKGTSFTMSLPLTLAVLDGMVVTCDQHTLVVPLTSIIETLKPNDEDVHGLGGNSRIISVRGTFVPLVDLAYVLGFREEPMAPSHGVSILVETENGQRVALLADAIQDQRQVVIKSLESNYGRIEGIAAATILGDGRVALIVDVDAIVATMGRRKDIANRITATTGEVHV